MFYTHVLYSYDVELLVKEVFFSSDYPVFFCVPTMARFRDTVLTNLLYKNTYEGARATWFCISSSCNSSISGINGMSEKLFHVLGLLVLQKQVGIVIFNLIFSWFTNLDHKLVQDRELYIISGLRSEIARALTISVVWSEYMAARHNMQSEGIVSAWRPYFGYLIDIL